MISRDSGARTASAPASDQLPYVALIRGINVGTAKRVGMEDIRHAFAVAGFADARTVLNSGNVIFHGPARWPRTAGAELEAALRQDTGVSARVHVVSAATLAEVVQDNALLRHMKDPSRLIVHFMFGRQPKSVTLPPAKEIAPDLLLAGRHALYQWAPNGQTTSRVPPQLWRALGDDVTSRNWRTVLRLQQLVN